MVLRLQKLICFLFIFPCACVSAEENFLLMNGITKEIVFELGPNIHKSTTPCSTFKIVLSLMGYEEGILKDQETPIWIFQKGYVEYRESWKAPQTPKSWIKNSCVWYSQLLALQLGLEKIQNYLAALEYGNQDMSGGLTHAWLSSSLKISPKGQVDFIQKMISGQLPISDETVQMTKELLFVDELPEGWKLFGKTGMGSVNKVWWFVGWIEKDHAFFPFAYNSREEKIDPGQRISRVKKLLLVCLV